MDKVVLKIAKRLWIAGLATLLFHTVNAQCTGGVNAGSITPTLSWQTIPCIKAGEYFTFNATVGTFYTFTFCTGGGMQAGTRKLPSLTT